MQNGSFGLRDEWFQPRFQQADTVCRATAVPGKVYPKWHQPMRRGVARYVSETRSCAAHSFWLRAIPTLEPPWSSLSAPASNNVPLNVSCGADWEGTPIHSFHIDNPDR